MSKVGETHHVKVGTHFLLLRPGSYRKRPAPLFGARFTTGDPSYNNLSFWQHWVQTSWIGGMDAPTWSDPKMYDQGVGVDTSAPDRVTLARDLTRGTGAWTVGGAGVKRSFHVYKSTLYALVSSSPDSTLYGYNPTTDAWSLVKTFTGQVIWSVETFGDYLYVAGSGQMMKWDGATTWTNVSRPASRTETVYSLRTFRDRLYACFGRYIWRLKSDDTWDGSTVFFEAVGIDELVAAEAHLGYLYWLSHNGHLLRTDGSATFDIWRWDGDATGVSLRSYDGRLFVGTYEYGDSAETGQGVLYQFSGSAVTQLKRWGKVGRATTIGNLCVHDRKLYYGAAGLFGMAAGFGVAVYDSIEDGHAIFASSRDTQTYPDTSGVGFDWIVDDVIVFRGFLFAAVRGYGLFRTPLRFRDVELEEATFDRTGNGADIAGQNGGWYTTSDYDAGTPGLRKLWRRVVVHVDLPDAGCSVVVETSVDGGLSWTSYGALEKTDAAVVRYAKTVSLGNLQATRMKLRLTLRSASGVSTPVVRGVVVSYVPQPDPQWLWELSAVISDEQQTLDGGTEEVDAQAILGDLSDLYRSGLLTSFTDVDGVEWTVLIYDFTEMLTTIEPPLEGELRLVLMEATED